MVCKYYLTDKTKRFPESYVKENLPFTMPKNRKDSKWQTLEKRKEYLRQLNLDSK